jgi:hypothetical protein
MQEYWAIAFNREGERRFWSPSGHGYLKGLHLFPSEDSARRCAESLSAWFRDAIVVKVLVRVVEYGQ